MKSISFALMFALALGCSGCMLGFAAMEMAGTFANESMSASAAPPMRPVYTDCTSIGVTTNCATNQW